jgi:hypothetical protein
MRCAMRWRRRRARSRNSTGWRSTAAWSAVLRTTSCAIFERLPDHAEDVLGEPLAAFVATRSVLVFDHLTRAYRVAARGHGR